MTDGEENGTHEEILTRLVQAIIQEAVEPELKLRPSDTKACLQHYFK